MILADEENQGNETEGEEFDFNPIGEPSGWDLDTDTLKSE